MFARFALSSDRTRRRCGSPESGLSRRGRHGCAARIVRFGVITSFLASVAGAVVSVGGCTTEVIKHGHQFRSTDLQRLQPGMSKDEVQIALGTPTTQSVVNNGSAFYYISSTRTQAAFFDPKEVDRKVVAVYFDPLGNVTKTQQYGMKDGKVIDLKTGATPAAYDGSDGILKQLFRNLGNRAISLGE